MTEIKRYAIICAYDDNGNPEVVSMEHGKGQWVRWEDVKEELIQLRIELIETKAILRVERRLESEE